MVESQLRHGIVGWGGAYTNSPNKLDITQKWFIEIIFKKNIKYPRKKLFDETDIWDIRKLNDISRYDSSWYKRLKIWLFLGSTGLFLWISLSVRSTPAPKQIHVIMISSTRYDTNIQYLTWICAELDTRSFWCWWRNTFDDRTCLCFSSRSIVC